MTGTIKWFNATKGFGFVSPDEGGMDVLVHISALEKCGIFEKELDGKRVSFEIVNNRGRDAADNLKLI